MATSAFSVANSDLQSIQPDILGFGITDFGDQLQFAENDVLRRIREEWWEKYRHTVRYKDITKITTVEMTSSKLTNSQWTFAVCYMALWKYVFPQLTKWREEEDAFFKQIGWYKDRYEQEFQDILRDGVEYDEDSGGTVADSEKEPIHELRLYR